MEQLVLEHIPWFNKKEFESIYYNIYHDNIMFKKSAVNRIANFQSRTRLLPPAIDATATLTRAVIQDVIMTTIAVCQTSDICMMYSIGLIRFVNLIMEREQRKNGNKHVALRVVAKRLKIPDFIVTLRHNATHSVAPSINALRNGAEFALSWLKCEYWEKELASFADHVILFDSSENVVIETITKFQKEQFDVMNPPTENETGVELTVSDDVMENIKKLIEVRRDVFLDVLIQPGLLIPTDEDLLNLLSMEELAFIDKESVTIPNTLQLFWLPVFKALVDANAIQEFVEMLVSKNLQDDNYQKTTTAWAMVMLYASSQKAIKVCNEKIRELHPVYNWRRLLYMAVKEPHKYTPMVIIYITQQIGSYMSEDSKQYVMALVALKLGALSDISAGKDAKNSYLGFFINERQNFLTVKDLKKEKERRRLKKKDLDAQDGEEYEVWRECLPDCNFSHLPLGALIDSTDFEELSFGDDIEVIKSSSVEKEQQQLVVEVIDVDATDTVSTEEDQSMPVASDVLTDEIMDDIDEEIPENPLFAIEDLRILYMK